MKYKIEKYGAPKPTKKEGIFRMGAVIGGVWHYGFVTEEQSKEIKGAVVEGYEVELELYESEYEGKTYQNFRFPRDSAERGAPKNVGHADAFLLIKGLATQLSALEKRVKELELGPAGVLPGDEKAEKPAEVIPDEQDDLPF